MRKLILDRRSEAIGTIIWNLEALAPRVTAGVSLTFFSELPTIGGLWPCLARVGLGVPHEGR